VSDVVPEPGAAELVEFSRILGLLRALPADDPRRLRAEREAESFSRDGRRTRGSERRQAKAAADRALAAATRLGAAQRQPGVAVEAPSAPAVVGELHGARPCYVCGRAYRELDGFYHRLCPACAAENLDRRAASADLAGRRALVTGGRVKMGFQLALMLLRDGAHVSVTTRFPGDAVDRFRAVEGSSQWLDRLEVVGIDLRDPRRVLELCDRLVETGRPLDILVNHAAQTVRRSEASYAALAARELRSGPAAACPALLGAPVIDLLRAESPVAAQALVSTIPAALIEAPVDASGLLPDPSPSNAWSARLGELDPTEILETQLVNAVAPALLCDRLLPLLLASPHPRRYIVNVSALEGRFEARAKTSRHPHTNMAKAALNMLTRTSAADLAEHGVYMCAVDTGWVTNENPEPKKARMAEVGFQTPLDVVDGAARIYDPIVRGEAGGPVWGVLLRNYREAAW
jgi:NAD(P)-dependent dehydrogenase (short-subunit alcohol dehydrogenase family)